MPGKRDIDPPVHPHLLTNRVAPDGGIHRGINSRKDSPMATKPVEKNIVKDVAQTFMDSLDEHLPAEDASVEAIKTRWMSILNGIAWVAARLVYAMGPEGNAYFITAYKGCLHAQIDDARKNSGQLDDEMPEDATIH